MDQFLSIVAALQTINFSLKNSVMRQIFQNSFFEKTSEKAAVNNF